MQNVIITAPMQLTPTRPVSANSVTAIPSATIPNNARTAAYCMRDFTTARMAFIRRR